MFNGAGGGGTLYDILFSLVLAPSSDFTEALIVDYRKLAYMPIRPFFLIPINEKQTYRTTLFTSPYTTPGASDAKFTSKTYLIFSLYASARPRAKRKCLTRLLRE